jgi:hypothetical protein
MVELSLQLLDYTIVIASIVFCGSSLTTRVLKLVLDSGHKLLKHGNLLFNPLEISLESTDVLVDCLLEVIDSVLDAQDLLSDRLDVLRSVHDLFLKLGKLT